MFSRRLLPFAKALLFFTATSLFIASSGKTATAVVPRGNRILAMDTNAYDGQSFASAAADAVAQGVTTTSIHLNWNRIESSPGVFNGPDAALWQLAIASYPGYHLNLMLTIGTLDTCQRDVPSDLATTRWNDPTMELRFQYLLNWLWLTANNAGQSGLVVAISIGSEVDVLLSTNTANLDNYSDYTAFFNSARNFLRASTTWNNVPTGVSTSFAGLSSSNAGIRSAIATLNTSADEVMYTYYPLNADFSVKDPYTAPVNDTATVVGLYPGRTIDIFEAGYQTSSANNSSNSAQQTFVSTMFGIWDAYYPIIHILRFVRQADLSLADATAFVTGSCSGGTVPGTPASPTVTPTGGTGSTTWKYYLVAVNSIGQSMPGSTGQTTAGKSTLTSSSYNHLTWTAVSGASWYDVIRSSAGGSPATTGKIGFTTSTSFDDTGLAASSYTDLTYNFEEYLRTLGLRYFDPVSGTSDKPGWTQVGIEAHARGW